MINTLKNLLLETGYFQDNEYLTAYATLLTDYDKAQSGYKEQHHVIPAAVYRYKYKCKTAIEARKLANKDDKNYTVSVLYKDHVLSHYFLYFCAKGQVKHAMARAAVNMTRDLNAQLDLTEFKYLPEQFDKVQQLIDCIRTDPDNNFYTPSDIDFLKLYYSEKGPQWCAEQLNKSNASIREKAHKLRLTQEAHKAWTDEEIRVVKLHYEERGLAYCRKLLPNRPDGSILDLAKRLGISSARTWTVDEERFLIENYTKLGSKKCAEILNRSVNSIKHKAAIFKLPSARAWTDEEVDILTRHYKTNGVDYCVKLLNRERSAIHAKARKLGIAEARPESWSIEELDVLKQNYERYGSKFCVDALPRRSQQSVIREARKLGLARAPQSWSAEELEFLKQNYIQYGIKFCTEHLVGRTQQSVRMQAYKLGLRQNR